MKKIIILIFGITFTISAIASNEIKKSEKNNVFKPEKIKLTKSQTKETFDPELCGELNMYFGECPDGSTYYAGATLEIYDCGNDNTLDFFVDSGYSEEEGCD